MGYDIDWLIELFDSANGECHMCEKKLAFSNHGVHGARGAWQVDHITPRALGGSNDPRNLAPACIPCNHAKGVQTRMLLANRPERAPAPASGALTLARRALRQAGIAPSRVRRVEILERKITVVLKSGKRKSLI